MSNKLTGRVWELQMGHAELIVLQALCDNAHDDGTHCYPSIPYLAWKTNYSERQVQRVLRDLEALRLIETFRIKTRKGTFQHFRIHLDNGTPKPPFQRGDILSEIFTSGGDKMSPPGDTLSGDGDKMTPKPLEEPLVEPEREGGSLALIEDAAMTGATAPPTQERVREIMGRAHASKRQRVKW